jgi:hypothetical protein
VKVRFNRKGTNALILYFNLEMIGEEDLMAAINKVFDLEGYYSLDEIAWRLSQDSGLFIDHTFLEIVRDPKTKK